MANAGPEILRLLRRDHLISGDNVSIISLAGGVSSDVFLIKNGENRFVLKRALPQLKVKDLWQADVSRNYHEYEFLKYVSAILPDAVPAPLALGQGYFTMEYLGAEFSTWKELLLKGNCQSEAARESARILAVIHKNSADDLTARSRFDTTANFHQLRTDPYLLTTGLRHPELRQHFEEEAQRLENTRECLIHGDYSPKNLLVGNRRLVLLDCEVAWYGDPAFDVAFLLNHLFLKSLYHMPKDMGLRQLIDTAVETYYSERRLTVRLQLDLDARITRLLLLLLLARVDGKSPVEYLTSDNKREFVRKFVRSGLKESVASLQQLIDRWFRALLEQSRNGPK